MSDSLEIVLPWSMDQIPFDRIDRESIRGRDDLFYLLTASSFVEILSDLTTRNLVSFFEGDPEVGGWLLNHWEHEEVQHGTALREYVLRVWPGFDWDATYASFFEEYSKICTVDEFEDTRCLEMVARCVVEMGTATYYRSMCDFAPEPVLRDLAGRIKNDEVRHYKHFYRFFSKYQAIESMGRTRVLAALGRRLGAVRADDASIALWHAFAARNPAADRDGPEFRAMFRSVTGLVKRHYPSAMAIKMFLRPLTLPPMLFQVVSPPLSKLTQLWILR